MVIISVIWYIILTCFQTLCITTTIKPPCTTQHEMQYWLWFPQMQVWRTVHLKYWCLLTQGLQMKSVAAISRLSSLCALNLEWGISMSYFLGPRFLRTLWEASLPLGHRTSSGVLQAGCHPCLCILNGRPWCDKSTQQTQTESWI